MLGSADIPYGILSVLLARLGGKPLVFDLPVFRLANFTEASVTDDRSYRSVQPYFHT